MGTNKPTLPDALFSKTLKRVLGLLYGNPGRSYFANEIVRSVGLGVGTVQRELKGLAGSGLVTVSSVGNQKHYQANPASPIFEELRAIATKVLSPPQSGVRGRRAALPRAIAAHQPQAAYAVDVPPAAFTIPGKKVAALCRRYAVRKLSLFGSAARGELGPDSDVDLMIEFDPSSKVSLWDIPKLQEEFSALFGGRRVDLVPPEVMKNPFRRKSILADLRVLYEA